MGAGASGGGDMGPGVDDGIGGFAGLGPVGGNIAGQGHGSPRKSVDDAVYDAPFNLGQNPFGVAQPGQPVSPISSLVSQVVAPSMVTHNLATPWSPDAVPTMNPRDEMGAWSGLVYDTINNPGQAVVDALQNKAVGAILGVPGALVGGLRTGYDALTSKQNPAPVESVNVTGGGGGYGESGSTEGGGYNQRSIFGDVNVDQIGMNRALNNNRAVIDALQEGSQSANFNRNAISQAGGDPRLAEARRIAEQRAAESMLAKFQPQGNTSGPITVTVPSTEEGEPDIEVTIPADDTVDDTTVVTKKPRKPRKPRNPRRNRPVRRPSKAKTIAKSLSKPKAFKKLPKFAQKELRRGIVPTTGSDHVQDMVRAFLGGQETFGDSGTRK